MYVCEKTAASNLTWVSDFPELARITDPAWLEAKQAATLHTLQRGTLLFRAGSPCLNFVLVVEGVIRVYMTSESGREILLYRVGAGEICVLTLSNLLGGAVYSAEGMTETGTCIVSIPPSYFNRALTSSHEFRAFIFSMIGRRLGEIMVLLEEITFKRLDIRLAQLLAQHSDSRGSNNLQMTHNDLAAELGSSREVISRILKEFERRGWVRLERGQIHIISRVDLVQFTKLSGM